MNRKYTLAGALAVAAALTLSACGMEAGSGTAHTAGEPHTAPATAQGAESAAETPGAGSMEAMIHIQDGRFVNPVPLAAGDTVTVMNMDATAVTILSDDSTSFTVSVPGGGLANFTAPTTPGSYPFHSGSGGMKGMLTVQAGAPSQAASMVCADEAKETVKEILALAALPETTDHWDGTAYSCTYPLATGDFVMTVVESANDAAALTVAKELAASLQALPIEGLANLGLPGYQSSDGHVVFAKDNMTLHVDASALPATVGPHGVTAGDFGFQMATTILGCWTAHHG